MMGLPGNCMLSAIKHINSACHRQVTLCVFTSSPLSMYTVIYIGNYGSIQLGTRQKLSTRKLIQLCTLPSFQCSVCPSHSDLAHSCLECLH
ncbi:hypothetical protein FKM82_000418 [Ascaphus truei]